MYLQVITGMKLLQVSMSRTLSQLTSSILILVPYIAFMVQVTVTQYTGYCNRRDCNLIEAETIKYKNLASLELGGDLCADPVKFYCERIATCSAVSSSKYHADRIRQRRENIFSHQLWQNNPPSPIQKAIDDYNRCLDNENNLFNLVALRRFVRLSFHKEQEMKIKSTNFKKIIYLFPQIILTHDEIEAKVTSMNRNILCYYWIESIRRVNSTIRPVIDRMYGRLYLQSNERWDENVIVFKQYFTPFFRILMHLMTVNLYVNREEFDFHQALLTMKIKSSLPTDLFDDEIFDRNFGTTNITIEQLSRMNPVSPWCSIPFYPDSVHYSVEENTLYISPTFLEKPLLDSTKSIAYNLAGMFNVFKSILMNAPRSIKSEIIKYFGINEKFTIQSLRSFLPELPHNPPYEMVENFALDIILIDRMKNHIRNRSSPTFHIPNIQDLPGDGSFTHRLFSDLCISRPSNQSDLDSFYYSTGRMHNLLFIHAAHMYQRDCGDHEPIRLLN